MELFIPSFIFNPQLLGRIVHAAGHDEEGAKVDIIGVVERAEAEALLIRGTSMRTIYAHEIGPDGIRLAVAGGWVQLPDNRPEDCEACGGYPDEVADCTVCKGTGRNPEGLPRMSEQEDDCMNGCGCPGDCRRAAREEWPE